MNIIEFASQQFGVLDHAPVGICVIRSDYMVLFWNRCLEDWTGIDKNDIVGTNLEYHFPDLGKPKYRRRLESIFEGGLPAIFSSQLHQHIFPSAMQNGNIRIQHTTVSGIPARDGKGFYALWAVTDVTELTMRIKKYRNMRNKAMEEVVQRKKTEEELKKANKKILDQQKAVIEEERLKVLLQMSGATAHELNQPLMALLGNIELMELNKNQPDKIDIHIKNIQKAGHRIADIVKKIQTIRHYEIKPYLTSSSIVNLDQNIFILYVEDSDENFNKLKSVVNEMDKVRLFRSMGIDNAIQILKNKHFDLIFSDCLLLDGTGIDLLRKLKNNDLNIPVIIITSQDDEMTATKMIESGAYDYINMSMVNKQSLLKIIFNSLEKLRLKIEIKRAQQKIAAMSKKSSFLT